MRPKITSEEQGLLWARIESALPQQTSSYRLHRKWLVGLTALTVFGGGVVTVYAANLSLPGDPLFPVNLAIEKTQLVLSSKEQQATLRKKFAQERIKEVEEVARRNGVVLDENSLELNGASSTDTVATSSNPELTGDGDGDGDQDDVDRASDVALQNLEHSFRDTDDDETKVEIEKAIHSVREIKHHRERRQGNGESIPSVTFSTSSNQQQWREGEQEKEAPRRQDSESRMRKTESTGRGEVKSASTESSTQSTTIVTEESKGEQTQTQEQRSGNVRHRETSESHNNVEHEE